MNRQKVDDMYSVRKIIYRADMLRSNITCLKKIRMDKIDDIHHEVGQAISRKYTKISESGCETSDDIRINASFGTIVSLQVKVRALENFIGSDDSLSAIYDRVAWWASRGDRNG